MIRPCPRCRRFDRVVLEVDERRMVEWIRCTRCRVRSPVVRISETAVTDPPNAQAGWDALPRQGELFAD